jgi:hypothetical protein
MLLGLIARSSTLAVNAGLIFLLSQQAPRLDWWHGPPKPTLIEDYRDHVLAGLERVRADLETNGKLLIPIRREAGTMAESRASESQPLELDQRTLRTRLITD